MKNKELLKRFLPYFKKYRKILFIDLFCAVLTTVCELVFPLLLRSITNTAAQDILLLTNEYILKVAGLYFALRVVEIVAQFYMTKVGHIMGAYIEKDMRSDAFAHLQHLSDSYYNNTKVGQIMARITHDLFDVTEFAHHCPEEFLIATFKIIISFAILIKINVLLTVLMFIMIPIMIYALSSYNRKMCRAFKEQRDHIGDLNSGLEDSLLGSKVVKSFANEDIEVEKFEKDNDKFLEIKKKRYTYMAGFGTVNRIFDAIMYTMIITLGGFLMQAGKISAGDMIAYVLFATSLLTTIKRIVDFMENFNAGMTGIERFIEIMDTDVDIFDKEDAIELKDVKGKIEFKDVSFTYPDDKNKVLSNVNLVVNDGDSIAIVGPSGSGKTTLVNLIPRFYDVTSGEILIDDKNIKDFTLKSLRQNIGSVQQEVYLFSGTILENIKYGKIDASKDEIIEAAKLAGAYDFIMELKDGFNTYVGERGVKLSGGQKQRIAIARVFLKNPKVLILDEATSALDNTSERLIQESLEKLSEGRTTLTIAHRLSTIKNAKTIIVLTDDGIKESGTHDELMSKKGLYYELYTGSLLDLK